MVAEAVDLEYLLTDSEAEALLLENNWIKRREAALQRPAARRQDLSVSQVDCRPLAADRVHPADPRRRRRVLRALSARRGLARKAIKLAQKLFEIRVCRIPIDGSLLRPCLYYDMRRCLGPCVDGLTTSADLW